jgi:ABC-type lipoprotein export system ATPase subunit/ABC-type antimicrobial peptide transport system permease subunit
LLYKLKNINKIYQINKKQNFYALKDINFSLPNKGLVSITGDSGSGKSTLLNILTTIDFPSSGSLLYKGKKIKSKDIYRGKEIGIIFQHYYLLEDESVLDNLIVASSINGEKLNKTKLLSFLEKVNLNESILSKKVKNLSGGEKQRIAIIRSLINNPKVIFADEPTGALDIENSNDILKILKELSKDILVVIVSHDIETILKISDMNIHLENGSIKKIDNITEDNIQEKANKLKRKETSFWKFKRALKSISSRKSKVLISLLAIITGFISSFIILGFSSNYRNAISASSKEQLDYGTLTIQKESQIPVGNSGMSLVRRTRLNKDKINHLKEELNINIETNFSYLVSPSLSFKSYNFSSINFSPIYSFKNSDKSLLLRGKFPSKDNVYEVVVNEEFANKFYELTNLDILNQEINLFINKEVEIPKELYPSIIEHFVMEENLQIVGIVKDFSFLTNSKIYYSFLGYKKYLELSILDKLYQLDGSLYSWLDVIIYSDDNSDISSYSHFVFSKNEDVKALINRNNKEYTFESLSLIREESYIDLIEVASFGLNIYLFISLMGVSLIIGIISFSSYSEDKKKIAILYALGSNKDQISSIYGYEGIITTLLGVVVGLILSPLIIILINKLLFIFTGINSLIPLGIIFSFRLLFVLISASILIGYFASTLPILFSKNVSIKEELIGD